MGWAPPEVDQEQNSWQPPEVSEAAPPPAPSNPAAYLEDKVLDGLGVGARGKQILSNAEGGAADVLKGFVPRTLTDVLGLATPVVGGIQDVKKTIGTLGDMAGGKSAEEALRANRPEAFALKDAEQTPAFSRERFATGFGTLAQMLMAGSIVHGMTPKPGLTETLFPEAKTEPSEGAAKVTAPEPAWTPPEAAVSERTPEQQAATANAIDTTTITPAETTPTTEATKPAAIEKINEPAGASEVSTLGRFAEEAGADLKAAPFASSPGARSAVETWMDRARDLKDSADSVKRFVENAPQRDEVAAKFDAANNQAGYVARQARNHVALASEDAKPQSTASDLQQKAATFVRQANGDKAGMLEKFDAIKGKGYDDVISYAKKNWDSLEKIAQAAKESTDAAHAEAEKAGVAVDYRDNYVKGAYHDPVSQKVVFDETGGGRGTGTSFKKGKVFNDYAEAIAAGFKPRDLRLDNLTESSVNSILKSVNRKQWANSLGEIKMPDGSPAVADSTENGSAPRGYQPVQVTPGNLVNVHEDLAPTIQALTADSMIPKIISHGSAFVKHNILVFDIFHGSRFAQMQGAFEGRIPSYHKGLSLLEFSDKDLTAAQRHGLIKPDEAAWARENRPKMEGLIKNGLNAGRISDAIYADAVPLMPGAKQANRFIFEKLSRGIITQSSVYALDRNAQLHPDWTSDQLNRYTAKEVNTYYRNLGNQGVFKSKTFQDLARSLVFAPQWIEGLVRSEARGFGQMGKLATTGSLGNIGKGMSTGLVAYFALAQMVNLLTRGKPTWENPEPGHKMDAYIPDFIQGSNGFFVSPLSVFAETTHDALKYTERGMEPLDVTAQLAANKLHPDIRAMRDLFGGKDFFGRPLHGWERVEQAASDVAPIPLFARTGGYKGGAERQILSTLGIKATPAPTSGGDVYQMAADFKRNSGVKTPDAFPPSDYADLRKALQNSDMSKAKEEYDKLSATKGAKKVDQYFSALAKRPFTGSNALEGKFRRTLDRGQLDLYTSALRDREEIVKRFHSLRK